MKRIATTVAFLAVLAATSGVGVIAGAGVGYMVGLPWALFAGAAVVAAVPAMVVALARLTLRIPDRPWLVYLWSVVALMGSLLFLAVNGRLQGGLNHGVLGVMVGSVFIVASVVVLLQGRLGTSGGR
jgi:hypothetical protein